MSEITHLTTAQLARRWALETQTLRKKRWCGGGPPYFKVGAGKAARVLYRLDVIETWEKEHTFSSTSVETVSAGPRKAA